jgi:hypothetical protein
VTYKQLQDECIALRFNEGNRASVKFWLNLRYAAVWNMADWHFKHVKGASLAVTAGDNTPTMPTDFAKSEGLFDQYGSPLDYLEPDCWREAYLYVPLSVGPAEAYTVIDREIWLGPTPSGTATYTLSYQRRLSHVDGPSGLIAAGVMVNDNDQPLWEAEYDYLLVLEACILGCQLLEFSYGELVPQRDEILAGMKEDLQTGTTVTEGALVQWGGTWQ